MKRDDSNHLHDQPSAPTGTSRRAFLQQGALAGASLILGFRWGLGRAEASTRTGPFAPNAFLRIDPDGAVRVQAKHLEMGQGSHTGLATILADELGAAWSDVRVEAAPSDPKRYANLAWGIQGTGGSSAIANSWMQLRKAGAAGRAMLAEAAAARFGVTPGSLRVEASHVYHDGSGRVATFAELASAASKLTPPKDPPLRKGAPRLIGTDRAPRVDARSKSDGTATFTMDVRREGMLTALIARPPRFGGTLKSFDPSEARKIRGFVDAFETSRGVAVLATSFWAAKKARDALRVIWDDRQAETRSTSQMVADYRDLAETPGTLAHADGDAEAALKRAAAVVEATFEFPYLAHAPMEPLDAVIHVRNGRADFWAGSQIQTLDHGALAKVLGLPMEKIQIHTQLAGGSFGRRATPDSDVAIEAAEIVARSKRTEPIRVVWTREDDLTGGRFRPMSVHKVRLGIDGKGKLSGWTHRAVSQSILKGTAFEAAMVKNGIDHTSVEGLDILPYDVTDRRLELHSPESPVTVLWWRSVGHSTSAFVIETLIDELATMAHADPVEFRRGLLKPDSRQLGVLNLAAEKAGWTRPPPPGRARGVAVHASFNSYVAQVAEVSVGPDGQPRVHKVVCAIDCGQVVNPRNVEAQMQSGIGFGLGAALFNEVLFDGGVPTVRNFDRYQPLRIADMPEVEVHILPSTAPPTGVGEPGVPPIAPAVANAWFQLTGQRVRRLPFTSVSA